MRRLARFVLALAALAAALPACAVSYLWEVTSLTNRVYLFGTVHAGMASWYPLPRAVEDAFEDSPVLVVEADITDPDLMQKSARATIYTPPANLSTHVPPEDFARFKRLLPRYRLPLDQVIQMKPFMAASLLVFSEWGRLGYDAGNGVDVYLLKRAKREKKTIVEIEGVDTQIALMDSLTDAENLAVFHGTLEAIDSGLADEQVKGMVAAWQEGDPDAVLAVAKKYDDRIPVAAEVEEKFIWSRHDAMVAKIQDYLDHGKERHFVAVGALHLSGPRGLLAKLRARGYVVKQL
ncbi:MAG TPA: TraB/GumN family protein [Usitatibacter sp.]|nr:TraB/GumN family protein [Usitatibacter sp.]